MKDDAVTESITHFIGLFSLTEEHFRLRLDYEEFRGKLAAEKEQALLEADTPIRDAPLAPRGYDPGLAFKATLEPGQKLPLPAPPTLTSPLPPAPPIAYGPPAPDPGVPAQAAPGGSVTFHLPPPSSIVAVVIQQNMLSDNDTVGVDPSLGQAARIEAEAAMNALEALAEALTPFDLPQESLDGDWFEIVETLVQTTEALAHAVGSLPGAVTGVTETEAQTTTVEFVGGTLAMTTAAGDAAQGVHVDGVMAEEMPDWQDLLPDLLRAEEEDAEETVEGGEGAAAGGTGTAPEPGDHDFSKDFADGQGGIDPDELGHKVSTGGNQLVNETTIQSTWLDAKVFVVGGDYLRFDGISQTNILVEKDIVPAGVASAIGGAGSPGAGASESHNFAKIVSLSRAEYEAEKASEQAAEDAFEEETGLDGPATEGDGTHGTDISFSSVSYASDGPGDDLSAPPTATENGKDAGPDSAPEQEAPYAGYPSNWAVTTIDGNLLQTNWSQQVNFVSDSDTVSFGFSGSSTSLSTGDNLTINDLNMWELGFQYDLIIIDGDMIDLTVIKQTNILLDSDTFKVVASDGDEVLVGGGGSDTLIQVAAAPQAVVVPTSAQPADSDAPAASDMLSGTSGAVSTSVAAAGSSDDRAQADSGTGTHAEKAVASGSGSIQKGATGTAEQPIASAAKSAGTDSSAAAQAEASAPHQAGKAAPAKAGSQEHAVQQPGKAVVETSKGGSTSEVAHGAAGAGGKSTGEATAKSAKADSASSVDAVVSKTAAPAVTAPVPEPVGSKAGASDPATETATTQDSAPASGTASADAAVGGPADGITASLADNLLVNKAEITTIGEDVQAKMDATYQETLESFQADKATIQSDVMTKPEFEGTETLRVLHIKGDFVTTNVVQQTNVLGDDDSVQLAIDEFAAGLQDEMEVTMGSNALANLASVKDSGMDSTIMANGAGYSDAVLHQAELVMPEMPDMPDMAAMQSTLASEAVAFLAEDMITKMSPDTFMSDFQTPMDMTVPSADVMQTMLT